MTTSKDKERKPLRLSSGRLELKKTVETGQVRQSFSHGRSKVVQVEVRRKRSIAAEGEDHDTRAAEAALRGHDAGDLTRDELAARARALEAARRAEEERRLAEEEEARRRAEEEAREQARREAEERERARREAEERARREAAGEPEPEPEAAPEPTPAPEPVAEAAPEPEPTPAPEPAKPAAPAAKGRAADADEEDEARRRRRAAVKPAPVKRSEPRRRGKLTITAALDGDDREERGRSLASVRRQREKERQRLRSRQTEKVVREVVIPETITVQELANRMAARGAEVIKALMKMGVMASINQSIDADTAELVAAEFGHNVKRVAESDVEIGLTGTDDRPEDLTPRPPVVTVMGHVDHGKTSLLDALRATDVAAGEAGGITQHIGAYQVQMASGDRITFIDTPGHEAFTAMRARGAKVTDIVVLVVAADDGIMPQTVEAIRHARAAEVPVVVAINKIDRPDANPERVRQELLQHELVVEEMGGDVLSIEVSAKERLNLDKLEEAILLQAEILDLKANPERTAQGVVVESKMEKGRGSVATVLIQRGTLKVGDIFIAGREWGRVRAMLDDRGQRLEAAGPATPVEVLGLQGTPDAGDDFAVVEDESRAREISSYRQRKEREAKAAATKRGTLEQMFDRISAGEARELPVVIKGDVQGSVEAIRQTLEKMGTDEVRVRVLHAAVGGINESDVALAKASDALVVGFNVRANPQAREVARRDNVDIRYYSIIYDVADELKQMLSGLLAPMLKERFLGYAQIREVFNITKVGKVAGCMVTEGVVKRGAKVRLLRDDVVVHEGSLGQLKRFKDDVKEVREGYECGMSFENYNDIQVGDVIECYEIEEVAATL